MFDAWDIPWLVVPKITKRIIICLVVVIKVVRFRRYSDSIISYLKQLYLQLFEKYL